jgi:hypothetical protein
MFYAIVLILTLIIVALIINQYETVHNLKKLNYFVAVLDYNDYALELKSKEGDELTPEEELTLNIMQENITSQANKLGFSPPFYRPKDITE